jgi:RNA polymerase sigma-B factor
VESTNVTSLRSSHSRGALPRASSRAGGRPFGHPVRPLTRRECSRLERVQPRAIHRWSQTENVICRRGEETALFRRYRQTGEPAVRDALIARFTPLAAHLARRYPSGRESEDVGQVAALALIKAVDRFDPDHGSAFASFATPTILGEIERYFRDYGWALHVPRSIQDLAQRVERATQSLSASLGRTPTPAEIADELGAGVEDVLDALASATAHHPEPLEPDPRDGDDAPRAIAAVHEHGYELVEHAYTVDSLLDCLPERDRCVVELRFRHELLQREIADDSAS